MVRRTKLECFIIVKFFSGLSNLFELGQEPTLKFSWQLFTIKQKHSNYLQTHLHEIQTYTNIQKHIYR
jgi:hypothetical protein